MEMEIPESICKGKTERMSGRRGRKGVGKRGLERETGRKTQV